MVAALAAGCDPAARPGARVGRRPPNIVYLLTDDQRADSLSCAGNPVLRTPHVDALAAGGVRFTNCFATSAVCMCSRASILTGQYPRVHGVWDFATSIVGPAWVDSYPMRMKRAGYRLGFVGKWGLADPMPVDNYDYWRGYPGQGHYFQPGRRKHLTEVQGDQAVEFIRGCRPWQPFCLAVSFKAPHVQDEGFGQPDLYARYPYERRLDPLYRRFAVGPVRTVDARPMPDFFQTSFNVQREGPDFRSADRYADTVRDLYRLLSGVDDAVGRIVAALHAGGFGDDTVVIYHSDHGSFYGEHGWGGKWLMHEESIRSPLVVYDPRLPPGQRGTTRDECVLNIDLGPTLLDVADVAPPATMQGRSVLPLVYGVRLPWRTEFFYEHRFGDTSPNRPIPRSEGLRTADWKYVRYPTVTPKCEQLYHLAVDPREERDLSGSAAHAGVLADLRRRSAAWGEALEATRLGWRWREPA